MTPLAHPSELDGALSRELRQRGQRVTPQRLVMHRVLRDLGRHVTAEEVLDATAERLPGVTLPTVYATLALFEELGIVRRVAAGGGALLYDPRTDGHPHFSCRACGRTVDLDASLDAAAAVRAAARAGLAAERTEVVVVGLCERCGGGSEGGEALAGAADKA